MRIAVVSSDKENVDERFGKADRFLIYDGEQDSLNFVGERQSEPLVFSENVGFDREMFSWIVDIIQDCDLVVSTAICKKPARELRRRGVVPVEYQGSIEKFLTADH